MIVELAKVTRAGRVESIHYGHACLLSKNDSLKVWGDENFSCFTRSIIKPIQAKIAVDILADDLTEEEIAIGCSSHSANDEALVSVKHLLGKFSNKEENLICGLYNGSGKVLKSRLHHNCSGKHALMLAACRKKSYSVNDYDSPEHPLQLKIFEELLRLSEESNIPIAVDGCGLPTFYLSLKAMAKIFCKISAEPGYQRLIKAMNKYPELIAGAKNFDTLLMKKYPNQFLAKAGAEGLMATVNLQTGEALIIKIIDGSTRAKSFIANHFIEELSWISRNSLAIERLIYNSRQAAVGEFVSDVKA